MTSRTHTPEDVKKIQSSWLTEERYAQLHTPQRAWAGLIDEEAIELATKVIARLDMPPATKMQVEQQFIRALQDPNSLWMLFAAEIEAKLKEKNT